VKALLLIVVLALACCAQGLRPDEDIPPEGDREDVEPWRMEEINERP
jgi:hypothetical protein